MLYVFDPSGKCVERNGSPVPPPLEAFEDKYGHGTVVVSTEDEGPFSTAPSDHISLVDGEIRVDPAWQPPAPPPDPLAELAQVVARNIAASPHDKRFLTQKAIGKQAISWIKGHPACTPQEAEDYVMGLVLAELPGQPVVPKLYWEHQGAPQGLAMSYLYEAIQRGYLPPATPLTWASLVGLIVGTPEKQIAAWLRSL